MYYSLPAVIKWFLWHTNSSEQESVIVKTLFINIKNWTKPSIYSKYRRFIFGQSLKFLVNNQSHLFAFTIAKMTSSFQKYFQICAFDRKF